jgi:hypothetical protein
MIKAITIGYPDPKCKDTHKILYSGNDKGQARAVAEAATDMAVVEVIYPTAYIKRIAHAQPVAKAEVTVEEEAEEPAEEKRGRGRPKKSD